MHSEVKNTLPFEEEKETDEQTNSDIRILFRSREDFMFAGVIGGLALYWKIDSSILRLIFLTLCLITGGLNIIIYLIMIKTIPLEPEI